MRRINVSYLYRCKRVINGVRCNARRSLKRKAEEYIRKPKCPACKNELTYMDKWQMKRNKETTCNCGEVPYPHRAGSLVWCKEHPAGPTDQDYEDRYNGAN